MRYHVLNRCNGRADVFQKDGNFAALLDLMAVANERVPLQILGYVLMPNHFDPVLWSRGDGELSRSMQWLLTSHVRRYHRHHHFRHGLSLARETDWRKSTGFKPKPNWRRCAASPIPIFTILIDHTKPL